MRNNQNRYFHAIFSSAKDAFYWWRGHTAINTANNIINHTSKDAINLSKFEYFTREHVLDLNKSLT